jgi:hypothetical protein
VPDSRFSRNSTLIPANRLGRIEIYGLGGIGSALVQMLPIMGCDELYGCDHDGYEIHNASSTAYPLDMVGSSKAMCATIIASRYGAENVQFDEKEWIDGMPVGGRVILAIDDMDVRKKIYTKWLENPEREWLIDTRMGGMSYEIITVTRDNDSFLSHWKPAGEIPDTICTARHTIFTAFAVASEALSQVQKLIASLPFYRYIWRGMDITELKSEEFTFEGTISESQGT